MAVNLEADLRERWLPSADQMALANALLAAGYDAERETNWGKERGVYTLHLLVNKHYGWWTEDVEIVFLDGVFLTREAALNALSDAARRYHEKTGKLVVGGYAWHSKVDHAAVWDDIGSVFPEER